MMKLQTPVEIHRCGFQFTYGSRMMFLGSCFSDNIGHLMKDMGFNVMVNPFGALYNPVSVCNSISRLGSGVPFTADECVRLGAGSDLICSFSHHTLAARATVEEFLHDANESLEQASGFFREAEIIVITLGTAWVFRLVSTGEVVSNCLKRDAAEFTRERLAPGMVSTLLKNLVSRCSAEGTDIPKKFIFTVSPIRHLKDGAHDNVLSKSILHLAVDSVCTAFPDKCAYFPAYEIMMDELRDYRFYAEDMVHPSQQAVNYIWEQFCDFALPASERPALEQHRKAFLSSRHRPLH